ncbi:Gag-Pol polyprotein [Lonchura striata]|uniref:Gag-Pol polyprotein n=1 Tax=Lonchura striata TaxID=40157 RepID=A0A218VDK5_9PASE|nr:Gag-Pol polyprotein [Lonchura striata domestica]
MAAPVLSLPEIKRPFQLFVDISNHTAHRVLTQDWAGAKKPVGYLSKLLDPVSRGWPTCLQAIVAVAILVEEAKKVTFRASLTIYSPHNVRSIVQQKADKWLTDARLLKYEAILTHFQDPELKTTPAQNPAQFLFGAVPGDPLHNCAEIVELQTKIRPDLEEEELEEGGKWFVDGSARVVEGKRKSGYAVINGKTGEVVESRPLSAGWLAQAWDQDDRVCLQYDKMFCFTKDKEGMDPENKMKQVSTKKDCSDHIRLQATWFSKQRKAEEDFCLSARGENKPQELD